jgi:putative DNA primase/helicase
MSESSLNKNLSRLSFIPDDLKKENNWLLWAYETRDDKPTKVPYRSDVFLRASSTDEETWSSYETTIQKYTSDLNRVSYTGKKRPSIYSGIGFVFDGSGIAGIDLDGAITTEGALDPAFSPIIEGFKETYMEKSPGGRGLHILLRCSEQPFRLGHSKGWKDDNDKREVAFYFDGRYFTVTGDIYGPSTQIISFDKEYIRNILKPWISDPEPIIITKQNNPLPLEDEDIIAMAGDARNGSKFLGLFRHASIGSYSSPSEADYALATLIAFYTRDSSQIQRIMEHSALRREKWTKRPEYLYKTIRRAINSTSDTYNPKEFKKNQRVKRRESLAAWGRAING